MSLLPSHQSSINNYAACSRQQALWKPQSQERRGECEERSQLVSLGTPLPAFRPARESHPWEP